MVRLGEKSHSARHWSILPGGCLTVTIFSGSRAMAEVYALLDDILVDNGSYCTTAAII